MSDITLCKGGECPKKDKCYRFISVGDGRQSYFTKPPYEKKKCKYYWKKDINILEDLAAL